MGEKDNATGAINPQTDRLSDREMRLATFLFHARTALWREWVENGSVEAKQAYDDTDLRQVEQ